MYGGPRSIYSLSRALLPMAILFPEFYEQTKQLVVAQAESSKRELLTKEFALLMDGVGRSLSLKNRSVFDRNMNSFYANLDDLRRLD